MIITRKIAFEGDFKLIFDVKFDASGGNPTLKKKSLAKLIEINKILYLSHTWRIRNANVTRFAFWRNHFSGFIERSLVLFSNF